MNDSPVSSTTSTRSSGVWLLLCAALMLTGACGFIYWTEQKAPPQAPASVTTENEERLRQLEKAINTTSKTQHTQQQLETEIAALTKRLAALEEAAQQSHDSEIQTAQLWLAYDALLNSIATGEGYPSAWTAFKVAATPYPAIRNAATPLQNWQHKGIATLSALKAKFGAATQANARGALPADASAMQSIAHNLRQLVVIRKIGDQHGGADDGAIIARAEAWLHKGNLAKAHEVMTHLSSDAAPFFVSWQRHATTRLKAETILQELKAAMHTSAQPSD